MRNKVGRELPEYIDGYGKVIPYGYNHSPRGNCVRSNVVLSEKITEDIFSHEKSKVNDLSDVSPKSKNKYGVKKAASIQDVLMSIGIRDGMTVSFHHHLRNGDKVTNLVMQTIEAMGIRDIHVAASGIFSCHDPLVSLIENRTIRQISVSTFGPGKITQAISEGKMKDPAILRTHGGRPRAIEHGELNIDIAFVAAPTSDCNGNANGMYGPSACGCLAYSYADVQFARYVVVITDHLVSYPCFPAEITENYVDYVVEVESIGDPSGIVSGAMKPTVDPARLAIAKRAADFLDKTGFIREDMSFQTGIGSISLTVAEQIRMIMHEKGIRGSFGSGGIHAYFIKMLREGLLKALLDVQCFDLEAIDSLVHDSQHRIMSASQYANPWSKGCVVDNLDIILLGGFEIDTSYNLNVITGSNGYIMSASGGNADTAAGSRMAVVVSDLMKKGSRCLVKENVLTVTTPGDTVDALVTDYGISVNPLRKDLIEKLGDSGFPLIDIKDQRKAGLNRGADETRPKFGEKIVAVAEYRDGTVTDVVHQVLPQ